MAHHQAAEMRLDVEQATNGNVQYLRFDPATHWPEAPAPLKRPKFLPIVGSHSLAIMLAKKTAGIDGFVVEGPTAGGHNTPPREKGVFDANGEPVYGPRDDADLGKIRDLGLPFWVAGGAGRPGRLAEVQAQGAVGIQVGTLFAYCDESGLTDKLRRSVIESAARGEVRVRTDARASPTGFPFKVVEWAGDPATGTKRERICDLGYLRNAYEKPGGGIGYRCASEPEDQFVAKGGDASELAGRKCLCNALLSVIGHPQEREEGAEPPILTSGDDAAVLEKFLAGRTRYGAADVVGYLLSGANGASSSNGARG
jgi:NAD(P)H-dependent flavin oxidoreductase YrpB (nitropropane dioxygenase family)